MSQETPTESRRQGTYGESVKTRPQNVRRTRDEPPLLLGLGRSQDSRCWKRRFLVPSFRKRVSSPLGGRRFSTETKGKAEVEGKGGGVEGCRRLSRERRGSRS